ncbi:MAG: LysE family translocator [Vicinamibacterales bacterium]
MPVDPLFAAFLSFTFVFVATPGSTTAVVVRNTLDNGRRAGFFTAGGAALANATHATVAGVGGATLLRLWPGALDVIRAIGAAYLAWLGLRSLWLAWQGQAPIVTALAEGHRAQHANFREGLAVNLFGPATITFYLTAVPTFIRPGWPSWAYAGLAACHVSMAFGCHATWVVALDRLRALFRRPGPRRLLGVATGLALLALAARIFVSRPR